MKIISFFKRKLKKQRHVLLHCPSGDIISPVLYDDTVEIPWLLSTCPFHLEPDGTVTLRLVWEDGKAKGYGKVWQGITWENLNEN